MTVENSALTWGSRLRQSVAFTGRLARRPFWQVSGIIAVSVVGVYLVSLKWPSLWWLSLPLALPAAAALTRRFREANLWPGLGPLLTVANFGLLFAFGRTVLRQYINQAGTIYLPKLNFWALVLCLTATAFLAAQPARLPVIDRTKQLAQYQALHHLSPHELALLRDTLGDTRAQIDSVLAAAATNPRLRQIDEATGGFASAQEIFRELMAHPHELVEFDDFLYQKMPSLAAAVSRVQTVRAVPVKTASISKSITEIYQTITALAASITTDYEEIVREDAADIALTQPRVKEAPHV